ncbi:hypothetical protein [Alteromonas flava]|uniref:hypothetical protein n=1 Tax=Alteromonas flava TaxID=2048003 RepID=UPI000C28296C|nr:hypothetical protein [Alteromonas flava]
MTKRFTLVIFLSFSFSLSAETKVDVFSSQLTIPEGFILAPYSRPLEGTNFYRGKGEELEMIIISIEDDLFIHENLTSEPDTKVKCGLNIKQWLKSEKEKMFYSEIEKAGDMPKVKLNVISPFGFGLSEQLIQSICAYEP